LRNQRPVDTLRKATTGLSRVPVVKDVSKSTRATLADFMQAGFCYRVWVLFNAGNAWISLGQFSFTVPPTTRALLLALRVHSSLFASAFFLSSTGAPSNDNDELCSPTNFWENVGRNIMIGFFSILVGSVPFAIMSYFAYRKFVYKESWDMETKRRYIKKMKRNAQVLWCIGACYCFFCAFFLMVFLANVGKGSELDWFTTAATDLMMSIVLEPFLKAVALVFLLDLLMHLRHDTVAAQLHELEETYEKLMDDEEDENATKKSDIQRRLDAIDQQSDSPRSPHQVADAAWIPQELPPAYAQLEWMQRDMSQQWMQLEATQVWMQPPQEPQVWMQPQHPQELWMQPPQPQQMQPEYQQGMQRAGPQPDFVRGCGEFVELPALPQVQQRSSMPSQRYAAGAIRSEGAGHTEREIRHHSGAQLPPLRRDESLGAYNPQSGPRELPAAPPVFGNWTGAEQKTGSRPPGRPALSLDDYSIEPYDGF